MTFNYAKSKATAERLISNFGQNVTLRKRTVPLFNNNYNPTESTSDTIVRAVDLNEVQRFGNASMAERTTRKLLVSTSAGVAPETGDQFILGDGTHNVGVVMPLSPGGTVIMYEAELID